MLGEQKLGGWGGNSTHGVITPPSVTCHSLCHLYCKGELSDMIPALCNKSPGWTKEFCSKYWLHEGAALFQIVH